jgi:hypothetical protein
MLVATEQPFTGNRPLAQVNVALLQGHPRERRHVLSMTVWKPGSCLENMVLLKPGTQCNATFAPLQLPGERRRLKTSRVVLQPSSVPTQPDSQWRVDLLIAKFAWMLR